MKTHSAEVEQAFKDAFNARPKTDPCDANRSEILEWLTENLKSVNAFNIVQAIDTIDLCHPNRLAATISEKTRAARLQAAFDGPPAPRATAPVLTEQEQLKELQHALRSSDTEVAAKALTELKARANREKTIENFNKLYSRRGLASMGKLELDAVVRLYGARLVSDRLSGK
jgi:hypothetical protein